MSSECDFTHYHYRDTIDAYAEAGYDVISFAQYLENDYHLVTGEKFIILRHDIDFNVEGAYRMSMIEYEGGHNSTSFVRLHAKHYNPFSLQNLRYLNTIAHACDIGLHYEPGVAEFMGINHQQHLLKSLDVLQGMYNDDEPIKFISQHSHKHRVDFDDLLIEMGRYDAYWFTHDGPPGLIKYLSDSGGRWREGCFCEWIGKRDRFQVNTHPVWWHERVPEEGY
jgi:hypothetical protein